MTSDVDPNENGGSSDEEGVDENDIDQVIEFSEQVECSTSDTEEQEDVEMDDESAVPLIDNSIFTFREHTGEVFSVDATSCLVATGGEDDRALVWNGETGATLLQCSGHEDSVVQVRFNRNRSLLASADMKGVVLVWQIDTGAQVNRFETGSDLEWLQWHPTEDQLLCGDSSGDVWRFQVADGTIQFYAGHGSGCTCGSVLPDGRRLVAGYSDGCVKIWNLDDASHVTVHGRGVHSDQVLCLAGGPENVAASGCEDGLVNLFYTTTGKIFQTVICSVRKVHQETVSVESVEFCGGSHHFLAVGSMSGDLVVWDLAGPGIRQCFRHPEGVVKCRWLPGDNDRILSAGVDGCLRLWSVRSDSQLHQFSGHTGAILDFAITQDGRVVTTSTDGSAKIFRIP